MWSRRLDAWLARLQAADCFAFDTEDHQHRCPARRAGGLSFAVAPGQAAYVPLAHSYWARPPSSVGAGIRRRSSRCWKTRPCSRSCSTASTTLNVLTRYGITIQGIAFDTMLESYVLDATGTRHEMGSWRSSTGPQHHPFRGHRRQGRQAADFDQIAIGRPGPMPRGCRRHPAPARDPLAQAGGRARPGSGAARHR